MPSGASSPVSATMAGQNFRFNSVTIDGVAQNDNFGLSKNASATQRTPISIDALEAINVNIAPFDVTYGNFVGGNINIVTKSGTNDFEGGVFAVTTDDSLTGNESDGADLAITDDHLRIAPEDGRHQGVVADLVGEARDEIVDELLDPGVDGRAAEFVEHRYRRRHPPAYAPGLCAEPVRGKE